MRATRQLNTRHTDPRYPACLAMANPVGCSLEVSGLLREVSPEAVSDPDALRLLGLLTHVITASIGPQLQVGEWRLARASTEEARVLARETGQATWTTGSMTLAAMVAGLLGNFTQAQSLAAEAEHEASRRGLNVLLCSVQLARGYSFVSTRRYAQGYAALRRIFDPADPAYHMIERMNGVMYLAEAAAHAGMQDDAQLVVAGLEQVARQAVIPDLNVHLLYARAVLADDSSAEGLYLAGLEADLMRWPLVKARLQLAYGSWLRRQRRVAESRPPLRQALTAFEVIGAACWAERARTELRAAGERPAGDGQRSATELLSPQELQIAMLAATGLSNKDIGERLFLSPRTIGSHLYRIFPKLGITARSQFAARLTGEG